MTALFILPLHSHGRFFNLFKEKLEHRMWPFRRKRVSNSASELAIKNAQMAGGLVILILDMAKSFSGETLSSEDGARVTGAFLIGFYDGFSDAYGVADEEAAKALPHYVASQRGANPEADDVLEMCAVLALINQEDIEPEAHEAGWNAAMEVAESSNVLRASRIFVDYLRDRRP
ncbi:MAG: hypothetical protein NTX90_10535 [Alphaproteobacteria bacterium]|nr:hypothetical protein [Alphaproteobacteria bacterium]